HAGAAAHDKCDSHQRQRHGQDPQHLPDTGAALQLGVEQQGAGSQQQIHQRLRPEQCCHQSEQSKQEGVQQPPFASDAHQLQQPQQQEGDRADITDQEIAVLVELRKYQDGDGSDQGKSVSPCSGGSLPTDLHDQCNESKSKQRVDKRVDDLAAGEQIEA